MKDKASQPPTQSRASEELFSQQASYSVDFLPDDTHGVRPKADTLFVFKVGLLIMTLLDEILFTPIRDIQVFIDKFFRGIWGPAHFLANAIVIFAAVIIALISIAKLILRVGNTSKFETVLKKLGTSPESLNNNTSEKSRIEQWFARDLEETEINYLLKPTLHFFTKKPLFRKKQQHCKIRYVLADNISKYLTNEAYDDYTYQRLINDFLELNAEDNEASLLKQLKENFHLSLFDATLVNQGSLENFVKQLINKINSPSKDDLKEIRDKYIVEGAKTLKDVEKNKENFKKIMQLSKLMGIFLNAEGEVDPEMTIAKRRKEFIETQKKFSFTKMFKGLLTNSNDAVYLFWILFAPVDFYRADSDTRHYSIPFQIVIVIGGLIWLIGKSIYDVLASPVVSVVHFIKANFFKSSKQTQNNNDDISPTTASFKRHGPSDKQLRKFFVVELHEKNFNNFSVIQSTEQNKKSFLSKINAFFFSEITSIGECKEILQAHSRLKEYEESQSRLSKTTSFFSRSSPFFYEVFRNGVTVAFWVWAIGAALYLLVLGMTFVPFLGVPLAVLSAVGAFFNDGLTGGIVNLSAFVVGMIGGAVYYGVEVSKKTTSDQKALQKRYKNAEPKLDELEQLEKNNERLYSEAKQRGLTLPPPPTIEHFLRMKKSGESFLSIYLQKLFHRFWIFLARYGSGVLIWRLLAMVAVSQVLSHLGLTAVASVVVAFTALTWPVIAGALVLGFIWAAVYTYKLLIKQSKIQTAIDMLENVEGCLLSAASYQITTSNALKGEGLSDKQASESALKIFNTYNYNADKAHIKKIPEPVTGSAPVALLEASSHQAAHDSSASVATEPQTEESSCANFKPTDEETTRNRSASDPGTFKALNKKLARRFSLPSTKGGETPDEAASGSGSSGGEKFSDKPVLPISRLALQELCRRLPSDINPQQTANFSGNKPTVGRVGSEPVPVSCQQT
jgi:hypothetical protein